jgi:hypothetical protein
MSALEKRKLRLAIAQRTGYRVEHADSTFDDDVWHVLHNDTRIGHAFGETIGQAWTDALYMVHEETGGMALEQIPDWPHDVGEALALCVAIARKNGWSLDIDPSYGTLDVRFLDAIDTCVHYVNLGGLSEQLARLALAALEAEADYDGER